MFVDWLVVWIGNLFVAVICVSWFGVGLMV